MSFEVVLDGTREFVNLMKLVDTFVESAALNFDVDGLTLRAMDSSRVLLVNIDLPSEVFSKYDVDEPELIGIEMERFAKILKLLAKPKDTLILRKGESNHLELILRGEETLRFKIPLLSYVEEEDLRLPKLPHKVKAVILAKGLKKAVKAASLVSDALIFVGTPDALKLIAKGETTEFEATMALEDEVMLDLTVKESAKSAYGISYLIDLVKAFDQGDEVILKFAKDIPLEIEYWVRDIGKATFLLAPRVEE